MVKEIEGKIWQGWIEIEPIQMREKKMNISISTFVLKKYGSNEANNKISEKRKKVTLPTQF